MRFFLAGAALEDGAPLTGLPCPVARAGLADAAAAAGWRRCVADGDSLAFSFFFFFLPPEVRFLEPLDRFLWLEFADFEEDVDGFFFFETPLLELFFAEELFLEFLEVFMI